MDVTTHDSTLTVPSLSGTAGRRPSRLERHAAERAERRARWWSLGWAVVVLAVVMRFWLVEFYLPGRVDGDLLAYAIRPGSWLVVALLAGALLVVHKSARVATDWLIVNFALGWACVQGLVWLGAGVIIGFGTSPYDFSGYGIARNAFFFLSALVGGEIARAYLVGAPGRKRLEVALLVPAVAIALGSFSVRLFDAGPNLGGFAAMLPTLAEGLATSLFVYMGGLPAGLVYRGVLEVLRWMLPLLPDLPAPVHTFIGTMVPVAGMLLVARLYPARLPESEQAKHAAKEESSGMRWWLGFAMVSVTVVWLAAGILGVRPMLIASRSMEPRLKLGDVVLAKPILVEEARPGNVILFHSDQGMTVHRVIKVTKLDGGKSVRLTTKGDANNEADERPVDSGSMVGRIVFVVPKVGWLSIGVKNTVAWVAHRL